MSIPQVPPRPARSQQAPAMSGLDIPKIPPRPNRRTSERSQSPNSDNFARSPFNEPPLSAPQGSRNGSLHDNSDQDDPSVNAPQRPPSVSLPSVGQEGSEYANIDFAAEEPADSVSGSHEPRETRNVAGDLPLHAPKPSFSKDNAKQRVATVTRTDSGQAAAVGIGKASVHTDSTDDKNPHERPLKSKVSFRTASSASTERPASTQTEDEHGIPEIGQRVPMYPDAGDVQAPSPAPFQQQHPAGIGFHNSGSAKPSRHHRRTPSGREVLPPGSYGLHGHGVPSADHFEQQWYAKHPEALEREEHGEYGPGIGGGRGEWALSSDDLNKLVMDTAKARNKSVSVPHEQIGYEASEEYSRMYTPGATGLRMVHSNSSQPHVESPLRKTSFPVDPDAPAILQTVVSHETPKRSTENALESETEDDDIYVPPPTDQKSKFTGNGYDPPTESFEPRGGNLSEKGGYSEETGYGVPILAPDEVARTPGTEFMQPAVSPTQSRRGSSYYTAADLDYHGLSKTGSRSGSAANSRPSSRPGSVHGLRFSISEDDRENMHTPLEDVDEYEPLFPDDEGNKKPITAALRLKQREHMKRFPSQDIWEDTPNSLQLQATVDTPEPAATQVEAVVKAPITVFESPEQEAARKGEVTEEEKAKLIPKEVRLAKSHFQPHLRAEIDRPGLKQRFPSKDIWEDSPDSAELTTTVGGEAMSDVKSPTDAGLEAGAVVQTSGSPRVGLIAAEKSHETATAGDPAMEKPSIPTRPNKSKVTPPADIDQQPPVPARPPRRLHQVPPANAKVPIAPSKLSQATATTETTNISPIESRKGPTIPDRAKPQVPARSAKNLAQEGPEDTLLSKVTSASSVGSSGSDKGVTAPPSAPKPKPAVPARPVGSKIAALQGGFMADLNSRLKLGPQGSKPQEKELEPELEEEKAPLADARKGRAKGPTRRKPVAPASEKTAENNNVHPKWSIYQPVTVWQTDAKGVVIVESSKPAAPTHESLTANKKATETEHIPELENTQADSQKEMLQAKFAVEESPQASEPPEREKLGSPEPSADLPTPFLEPERNPLSIGPDTAISKESPVVKSPSPPQSDSQSQTGVKKITVMPGTAEEEKMTAIIGGEAQTGDAEAGNTLIRES